MSNLLKLHTTVVTTGPGMYLTVVWVYPLQVLLILLTLVSTENLYPKHVSQISSLKNIPFFPNFLFLTPFSSSHVLFSVRGKKDKKNPFVFLYKHIHLWIQVVPWGQGFFSTFLMGGTQFFSSPSVHRRGRSQMGGTYKNFPTEPKISPLG